MIEERGHPTDEQAAIEGPAPPTEGGKTTKRPSRIWQEGDKPQCRSGGRPYLIGATTRVTRSGVDRKSVRLAVDREVNGSNAAGDEGRGVPTVSHQSNFKVQHRGRTGNRRQTP